MNTIDVIYTFQGKMGQDLQQFVKHWPTLGNIQKLLDKSDYAAYTTQQLGKQLNLQQLPFPGLQVHPP